MGVVIWILNTSLGNDCVTSTYMALMRLGVFHLPKERDRPDIRKLVISTQKGMRPFPVSTFLCVLLRPMIHYLPSATPLTRKSSSHPKTCPNPKSKFSPSLEQEATINSKSYSIYVY